MTDASGAVQARYDYDPYGRRTKVTGNLDADFGFTGHYYHQPSGLHFAVYRAYDADLGRWINRDPIAEAGGLNLYDYVYNSPTNLTDSYGLEPLVPLDAGQGGQTLPRADLEHQMSPSGPLSPDISRELDRGCIGLVCAYQGLGHQKFPEDAPGTNCYLTESEARARKCGDCEENFVFGKQGKWRNGPPIVDPQTRQIPNNSVFAPFAGLFNYIVSFPGTRSYAWMNHGADGRPQNASIQHYAGEERPWLPEMMWCSTCRKKQ